MAARRSARWSLPGSLSVVLALGGACNDDILDGPKLEDAFGYRSPSEMPSELCTHGSFAGAEFPGIYHAEVRGDGQRFELVARVAERPPEPGKPWTALRGALWSLEAELVQASSEGLFLRAVDAQGLRALWLCARDEQGALRGSYVRCTERGCYVAEVTGKALVRLDEPAAHGLSVVGETAGQGEWGPGLAVNVRVADGVAYIARYGDGLRLVDVSDPARPRNLGHVPTEDDNEIYNDVKVVPGPDGKRYALAASNTRAAVVIDVTSSTNPFIAGHFGAQPERSANVHTLAVADGRAYLANVGAGLDIYDISDPAAAHRLGTFTHPARRGFLHDLHVIGDRAYLNWWDAGMAIVDVSAPATPRLVGNFAGYGEVTSHSSWAFEQGGRRLALHGDEQYGAHLRIVDVTEGTPEFTTVLSQWMTRPEVSIHNVMVMGHLAVIAYYHDGVRVLDLRDPARPQQVAWFNTWPGASIDPFAGSPSFFQGAIGVDVDPLTRTIYVADSSRGLVILRLDQAL